MVLSGGCFCGGIRYECSDRVFHATTCHCPSCRRISGAPAVAWFSVALAEFRFSKGEPALLRSSASVTRTFCPACGSALTYRHDAYADEVDVTICSLDQPGLVVPEDHTFTSYRLAWDTARDGKPEFSRSRAEG